MGDKKNHVNVDAVKIDAEYDNIPDDVDTVISFIIPYAIPVPDHIYKLNWKKDIVEVAIQRLQRKKVGGMIVDEGNYVQYPYDKYGQSSVSSIKIKIPRKIDKYEKGKKSLLFGQEETQFRDKEIAIEILNHFIEKVRYFIEAFWIESIKYQDFPQYEVIYLDGKKPYFSKKYLLSPGKGPTRISNEHPFKMEEDRINEFQAFLEKDVELDFSKIFLMNAKDACLQEDYRLAIIESIIALEITLSNLFKQYYKKIFIHKKINKIEKYLRSTGLEDKLKNILYFLKKEVEIKTSIIKNCMMAINIRNEIVHEGRRNINHSEAEISIIDINKMISFIEKIHDQRSHV